MLFAYAYLCKFIPNPFAPARPSQTWRLTVCFFLYDCHYERRILLLSPICCDWFYGNANETLGRRLGQRCNVVCMGKTPFWDIFDSVDYQCRKNSFPQRSVAAKEKNNITSLAGTGNACTLSKPIMYP